MQQHIFGNQQPALLKPFCNSEREFDLLSYLYKKHNYPIKCTAAKREKSFNLLLPTQPNNVCIGMIFLICDSLNK